MVGASLLWRGTAAVVSSSLFHTGAQRKAPFRGEVDPRAWTDEVLIEALVTGHPEAGDVLYSRLVRIVDWSIGRVLGRHSSDHEDLVQAAFEQIVTTLYRNTFARGCTLHSWAAAVASRLALSELRSKRRRRRNFGEPVDHDAALLRATTRDGETIAAARQELERVRQALSEVHPDNAEVLVLREVHELELSEIARTLNLSMTATYSRLSRGKKELAERLAAFREAQP